MVLKLIEDEAKTGMVVICYDVDADGKLLSKLPATDVFY